MLRARVVTMGVLGGALCVSAYRFGARALGRRALGLRASASSAIGSPLPRAAEHGSCIYLDYQATSPVWPEVAEAAIPYLTHHWGNPSSGHAFGRPCAAAVSHARSAVAQLIGARPDEIIFTGCGSEADNHAILGVIEDYEARQRQRGRGGGAPLPHVVTSNVEHPAITECLEALRAAGRLEVSYVPVDEEGRVAPAAVAAALTEHTVLVTVMHSNNEVGAVQDLGAISKACKAARPGVLVHTDAAQSIGKLPVSVDALGVDMLTLVGHKFGAPKGVAALYVRQDSAPLTGGAAGARKLPNFVHGGGQEGGRRAGTECVVLLVALGRAAEIAISEADELAAHMRATRGKRERSHTMPTGARRNAARHHSLGTISHRWTMVAPRVAVVTGANKGIGYHIAQSLVHSGLFGVVVLGCRDPTRGQQAAAAIGGCAEYMPLEVGNAASADAFAETLVARHGRCDVLVNNAGIAFKDADPTPFAEQTKPTLDVNYRGTIALTKRLLPLLQAGDDPRIVNVASMAGKLKQLQPPLQARFSAASLTLRELDGLVDQFEADVQAGTHQARGWGRSNYGLSKLALIAATQVLGRECPDIKVNACCPGYCDTDMTSHRGPRSAHDGAQNAVMLATLPRSELPSGAFFQNGKVSAW